MAAAKRTIQPGEFDQVRDSFLRWVAQDPEAAQSQLVARFPDLVSVTASPDRLELYLTFQGRVTYESRQFYESPRVRFRRTRRSRPMSYTATLRWCVWYFAGSYQVNIRGPVRIQMPELRLDMMHIHPMIRHVQQSAFLLASQDSMSGPLAHAFRGWGALQQSELVEDIFSWM